MTSWDSGDARLWTIIMNNRDEYAHWMSRVGIKHDAAIGMSKFSRRDVVVKDIAREISERYQPERLSGIDRCNSRLSVGLELHRILFNNVSFGRIASHMITMFEQHRNIEATKCL